MNFTIYTDGSYRDGIWGAGAVILNEQRIIIKKITAGGIDTDGIRNIAGETQAVLIALRFLYRVCVVKQIKDFQVTVFHDYIGLQKWADGEWKTKKQSTIAYKEAIQKARQFFPIKFKKVAAHSGNKYNDIADALAKVGVEKSISQ